MIDGDDFNATFNGMGLADNIYVDNFVSNGVEYCYEVEAVYEGEASDLAGPTCAMPEAQTIYELYHDDGTDETSINSGFMNPLCVKFTPEAYPVDLYRATFYCVGTATGDAFVTIWDDDGADGMPGTILLENYPATFIGGYWTPVSLSGLGITITEGSFYVGWVELNSTPPIGVDSDNSPENSFIDIGYNLGLEPFGNYFDGALMIRVEVDSANALGLQENLDPSIPREFSLNQNYPNPFNPTTKINYELPNNDFVSIDIYDVMGHRIKSLVSTNQDAGYKSVHWNATNDLGQPVSAGMYIYTIQAGEFRQTRKMVLLK